MYECFTTVCVEGGMCVCVICIHMQYLWRPEEAMNLLKSELQTNVSIVCWELNMGLLLEQPTLFTHIFDF